MRSPGLQVERTSLAWQRSALAALLVCAANLAVAAWSARTVPVLAALGATVLAAVASWATVPRRVQRLDDEDAAGYPLESPLRRLTWSASVVVCLALAALAVVAGRYAGS